MNVKSVSQKVKSTTFFITGITLSIGNSYLYRLAKIHFELDASSFAKKIIFLMMLLALILVSLLCFTF